MRRGQWDRSASRRPHGPGRPRPARDWRHHRDWPLPGHAHPGGRRCPNPCVPGRSALLAPARRRVRSQPAVLLPDFRLTWPRVATPARWALPIASAVLRLSDRVDPSLDGAALARRPRCVGRRSPVVAAPWPYVGSGNQAVLWPSSPKRLEGGHRAQRSGRSRRSGRSIAGPLGPGPLGEPRRATTHGPLGSPSRAGRSEMRMPGTDGQLPSRLGCAASFRANCRYAPSRQHARRRRPVCGPEQPGLGQPTCLPPAPWPNRGSSESEGCTSGGCWKPRRPWDRLTAPSGQHLKPDPSMAPGRHPSRRRPKAGRADHAEKEGPRQHATGPSTDLRPSIPKRATPPSGTLGGVGFEKIRRRPTLPGGYPPSTIGAGRLNFRVRDGNGCDSAAMATGNLAQLRVAPLSLP